VTTQKRRRILHFAYKPVRVRQTGAGPRFRVGRLIATRQADARDIAPRDVSHLLDRTYDYASSRELRWHLAERFNLPVNAVTLNQH
jgi:hypothetical protein